MTTHKWNEGRGTSTQRGYGSAWRRLRDRVLARDHHLCQSCLARDRVEQATEVDHILLKARGGTDDMSNLQSLCSECHATKSAAERGRERKKRPLIGPDGYPLPEP